MSRWEVVETQNQNGEEYAYLQVSEVEKSNCSWKAACPVYIPPPLTAFALSSSSGLYIEGTQ